MSHIQLVDELVREYLVFKGYPNSLKSFDTDLKNDRTKNYRQDRILEEISNSIHNSDLNSLRFLWADLQNHLFCKLEYQYMEAVKKLEQGLFKYYLIVAHNSNRSEKITDFFTRMASELHNQPEWKDWFYFPFASNPAENPSFSVCFTKAWQDTLILSLHNFLAVIFICMPQPTLSRAESEAGLIRKLQEENTKLRQRIQSLCSVQPNIPSTSHQSRVSTFYDKKLGQNRLMSEIHSPSDIIPFDIAPPQHLIDDFYIIAQETTNISSISESQAKGFRSLIRNIGSSSPVLGRKDGSAGVNLTAPSLGIDKKQKRSGSVGSNRNNKTHY